MAVDPTASPSPLAPQFDTRSPVSPLSLEPRSPVLEGASQPESELIRQLRADLGMSRISDNQEGDEVTKEPAQIPEKERQDLYQEMRDLRLQLQREKLAVQRQRDQADIAKEQSRAWVESLQEKLRGLREEKKSWVAEAVELRSEVSELKKALDAQGKQLAQESVRAFKLAAQRLEESPKFERVANFERRIDQLMAAQRLWAEDIRKLSDLQEFIDLKENEFQRLSQVLRGRIHEIDLLSTAIRENEGETAVLKAKLAAADRALKSKALSPIALEYAAEVRAQMTAMEVQMKELREENEELSKQNDEQAEMIHELRMQLDSAPSTSTPLSASDSLRQSQSKGTSSVGSRSRRASEDAGTHTPHLSLQLSPAAAVPPVLSTPLLSAVVASAFPNSEDAVAD
ncbi:hypothetical protein DACRYDRAFT_113835, partial [Dacryopinax primogenitus]